MALRLHIAAHYAEGHHRSAVLGDHRWDDRVKWPLAWGVAIGPPRRKIEQLAAVLQAEPESSRAKSGAEAAEIALNERDHVSVPVRGRQINCVPLIKRRIAGGDAFCCALGID